MNEHQQALYHKTLEWIGFIAIIVTIVSTINAYVTYKAERADEFYRQTKELQMLSEIRDTTNCMYYGPEDC